MERAFDGSVCVAAIASGVIPDQARNAKNNSDPDRKSCRVWLLRSPRTLLFSVSKLQRERRWVTSLIRLDGCLTGFCNASARTEAAEPGRGELVAFA